MSKVGVIVAILFLLIFSSGCQKDQEKISQLEKETMDAEAADYMPQSSGQAYARSADTSLTKSRNYVLSPDKIPEEFTGSTNRKAKTDAPIISLATAEAKASGEIVPAVIPVVASRTIKTGYSVQIGSTTNREEAESLTKRFAADGYEAFISETIIKGATYYRVRIGDFESFSQARKLGLELQKKFSVKFWVAGNTQ